MSYMRMNNIFSLKRPLIACAPFFGNTILSAAYVLLFLAKNWLRMAEK
jgi:hypothetical protein